LAFCFVGIDWEYSPDYRNCQRLVLKSNTIAAILWKRIVQVIDPSHFENMHPYGKYITVFSGINLVLGFDNEGTWRACGVNECIRFSKYPKGTFFQPHRDGLFVRTDNERSIFTLMVRFIYFVFFIIHSSF
jgi:hypothetical protein